MTRLRDHRLGDESSPGWAGAMTSRLGRRFVLLFAIGALLPLMVFAGLSVTHVAQQMRSDLRTTLHDAAKDSGMGIAARFGQLEGDLRLTADLVQSRRADDGWSELEAMKGQVREHCDGVWLVDGGAVRTLLGDAALPAYDFTTAQRDHLTRGLPLVHLDAESSEGVVILMLLQVKSTVDPDGHLVARVRPSWFWDPQELRGANCEFAACDPRGRILYHTFGRQPENELLAASVARRESSGSLEWDVDGVPHLGRYWHAFLRPQYGVDLWVLQSRSQSEAFAVGRSFERGFWLTAACTLLCVVLVGLVTMRRTLDPIMSLRDATRMLGGGALDVRVDIEAKDEFGELGVAFNDMAARLQENIAQRERTERELVTSRDAALAAVKAKAEFVTNVSHEFRTPMAEILGAAEILTQIGDDPDGGVREEFSAIALHGAKRLARLLDDVLELGETGNTRRGQLDVSATVGAAVEGLPREVRARVHVRADHGLPSLSGDEQGLVSTWRRLLDNAAKFSASSAPIDVDVERAGDDVVVRVRDQGVGIAPADLAAVFEPFSQVGRDQLVDKAQGTGLGLALAKAVVEAHGGAISAESTLGAGTTFTVRLPVTPLHAAAR